MRGGAEVACEAHNLEVEGSIPSPATKSPIPGGQDNVIEWFDSTMVPINHREIPMDKELKVSLSSDRVKLELQLRAFAEQTRRHPVS